MMVEMQTVKKAVKKAFLAAGIEVRRPAPTPGLPVEFGQAEREIFAYIRAQGLSMVSDERLFATILACRHVIEQQIPGDFVECGVYKGGNALIAAALFKAYGVQRKVWLFDTFLGMTEPTALDKESITGVAAMAEYRQKDRGDHNEWVFCPIDQVRAHFDAAGLLTEQVVFVQGDVLHTLKDSALLPDRVSVLRLDTDWYESTRIELQVLYPRLSVGGVLLIDDYGHFSGAQQATDEYFASGVQRPLLNYTDYTGRVGVKTAP